MIWGLQIILSHTQCPVKALRCENLVCRILYPLPCELHSSHRPFQLLVDSRLHVPALGVGT